jgi:hypothetical protein
MRLPQRVAKKRAAITAAILAVTFLVFSVLAKGKCLFMETWAPSGWIGTPLDRDSPMVPTNEKSSTKAASGASLALQLLAAAPAADARAGARVSVWVEGDATTLKETSVPMGPDNQVFVPGACRPGSVVAVEAKGMVSAPTLVPEGTCDRGETLRVSLHPAGKLLGKVTVDRTSHLPSAGTLALLRCPNAKQQKSEALGAYAVAVADDGSWERVVPTGCFDLKLRAPGFAPAEWLGKEVAQGGKIHLGAHRLVPGASLVVRVVADTDGLPLEGVRVDAIQESLLEEAAAATFNGKEVSAAARGRTSTHGWVRLEGLAAGVYFLRATATGTAPAFGDLFRLRVGEEETLADLRLSRPGSIQVVVSGQVQDEGAASKMSIRAVPDFRCRWLYQALREVAAPSAGTVSLGDLRPGKWQVTLYSATNPGDYEELAQQQVEVAPGASESVTLDAHALRFHGTVTLREQPVKAKLAFSPLERTSGSLVRQAKSGDDGAYSILLRQPGDFSVEVFVLDGTLQCVVPKVTFRDPDEAVDIVIPQRRVEGYTVDGDGNPVAGAGVTAMRVAGIPDIPQGTTLAASTLVQSLAKSSESGAFVLDGLAAGSWEVRARTADLESDGVSVTLAGDKDVVRVRLVMSKNVECSGTVLSAEGVPVRRAFVFVSQAAGPGGGVSQGRQAITDARGWFSVKLPQGLGDSVNVEVAAAGFPAAAFRKPLARDLQIGLPAQSGRVVFAPTAGNWRQANINHFFLVGEGGVFLELGIATYPTGLRFDEGSESSLVLPWVAPGSWHLVRASTFSEANALISGLGWAFPPLAAFEVLPGGTTNVPVSLATGAQTPGH